MWAVSLNRSQSWAVGKGNGWDKQSCSLVVILWLATFQLLGLCFSTLCGSIEIKQWLNACSQQSFWYFIHHFCYLLFYELRKCQWIWIDVITVFTDALSSFNLYFIQPLFRLLNGRFKIWEWKQLYQHLIHSSAHVMQYVCIVWINYKENNEHIHQN